MLWEASVIAGYRLAGLDGEIGTVRDFYFDDQSWVIRYLIADTGNWLTGIHISIARAALIEVNGGARHISVDMTREQIERSPVLSSQAPVSEQLEAVSFGIYGSPEVGPDKPDRNQGVRGMRRDPHLRSTHHVRGCQVEAADGDIGVVSDFIIDDATWAIRYLVIDTQNWLEGRHVLISPRWIERVSWSKSRVFISPSREAIEQSPEYVDGSLRTREYETNLREHYDRRGYRVDEPVTNRPGAGSAQGPRPRGEPHRAPRATRAGEGDD
jgi:uncharacterized protein YrrD